MFKLPLLAAAGAAAIALGASAPSPAQAASVHLSPAFALSAESNVIEVQRWRRDRDWRHGRYHRRDRDAMIALGIGSAIVGGMIATQQPYGYGQPYGYASSGWDQCAAQFRSLRADGTYTTYDGRQVLCPYLR